MVPFILAFTEEIRDFKGPAENWSGASDQVAQPGNIVWTEAQFPEGREINLQGFSNKIQALEL